MIKNIFCLVFGVFILYQVKYSFISIEDDIVDVKKQIKIAENEYRILETNWKFLTSPERIQHLSDKFLTLEQTTPMQMHTIGDYEKGKTTFVSKKKRNFNKY